MSAMVDDMPLRSMMMMGGDLTRAKLEAMLIMINGHFFKGWLATIKSGKG